MPFRQPIGAIATHDGPGYQAVPAVLGNAAERDMRIVEGIEATEPTSRLGHSDRCGQ